MMKSIAHQISQKSFCEVITSVPYILGFVIESDKWPTLIFLFLGDDFFLGLDGPGSSSEPV